MRPTACIVLLSVLLVGCDGANSQSGTATQQTPRRTSETVEEYIAGWGEMGMWLPDAEQVAVFRDNFDSTRSSLRDALANPDDSVRMRAAYVIGEIGDSGGPR
ncbi:MAG: hypothetical protein ACQESR_25230 [Planctomycetota bacterium]